MKTIYITALLALFCISCFAGPIGSNLQWSTYFGGNSANQGDGVATDRWGNVYITGETTSPTNIATAGAYQTTYGGGSGSGDAFLAKFSPAGSLLWATYFGGPGEDGGMKVTTDDSGNVIITGITTSATGIATPGAYQTTADGAQDAFLAKFDSAGALLWATYLGGAGTDVGDNVATDSGGNVFITGCTTSTGLATHGAYDTVYGGGNISGDGFLAKFTSAGVIQWATYFGGAGNDGSYGLATGDSGNVFITGFTASTSGIATPGSHRPVYSGIPVPNTLDYYNAFLAKFDGAGAIQWATYYGGDSITGGIGAVTDALGNVYITGSTNCPAGIATPGAWQTTHGGNQDAFIAKFNAAGAITWATYYGGASNDQGFVIAANHEGGIWIAGPSTSTTAIASPGAWQDSLGNSDFFIAEFDSAGNRQYGSYYGVYDGYETGLATDYAGNVYIGGVTTSATGMATTGAYDTNFSGTADAWLAKFSFSVTTGIESISSSTPGILLYPNPAQNTITISSSTPFSRIVVSNLFGQTVYSGLYDNSNKATINLGELASGIYIVTADNNRVCKVVKK